MKIKSRSTHSFVDLIVDETESTIFYKDDELMNETISNLIEVANELSENTGKSFEERVKEYLGE